jgi:transcriptional regulator with XRE-family HTH domain
MGEREAPARAREVGYLLRDIREANCLTVNDVADRLGWSPSKVSRVERGLTGVPPTELVRFAVHCGAHLGDGDQLLDWCVQDAPSGYWLSDRLASLIFHEYSAESSSSYDTLVVPGLLQTEEYATALISAVEQNPRAVQLHVRTRMSRQHELHRRGFEFFIHEQALQLPVGGNRVMNEQMLKLVLLAEQPRITIRVVPTLLGERGAFHGEFVLFRFSGCSPLVYLDHIGLWLEDRDQVAKYQNRLARLADVALDRGQSRELLAALASEFDQPEDSPDAPLPLAEEQLQRGT